MSTPSTDHDRPVDAAARLLLLWGRKAMPFHRLRAAGDEQDVRQVQLLFSGY